MDGNSFTPAQLAAIDDRIRRAISNASLYNADQLPVGTMAHGFAIHEPVAYQAGGLPLEGTFTVKHGRRIWLYATGTGFEGSIGASNFTVAVNAIALGNVEFFFNATAVHHSMGSRWFDLADLNLLPGQLCTVTLGAGIVSSDSSDRFQVLVFEFPG